MLKSYWRFINTQILLKWAFLILSLLEKMEAPLKFLPRWCLSDVISVFNCTLSVAQLVPMEHGRSWFWFLPGPLRVVGHITLVHRCFSVTYVWAEFCRQGLHVGLKRLEQGSEKPRKKVTTCDQLSIRLQHGLWQGTCIRWELLPLWAETAPRWLAWGFDEEESFVFSQLLKPASVF